MKFSCPIHGNSDGVRIAAVSIRDLEGGLEELVVNLECLTCEDHLGSTVYLPLYGGVMEKYELPEFGSNIYNALKRALKKRSEERDEEPERDDEL